MAASALEDIAPTCPCEDPTPGTAAVAGVAYAALVDQHMVPLERTKDRMPDLLPVGWFDICETFGATDGGDLGRFSLSQFFETTT
jgi:hypothetical protein